MRLWSLVITLVAVFLGTFAEDTLPTSSLVKPGKCPALSSLGLLYSHQECTTAVSDCSSDRDCPDIQKCCSNSCAQVCTTPLTTGCQQLRRLLELQSSDGYIPKCLENGEFDTTQCNPDNGSCFCVDQRGLEIPGTRAKSLELVNCENKKRCAGFLCKMLCPYGFELENDGCPLCQCRNPCKGVSCPAGQECSVEEAPCSDQACPPLPTCKKPRSLDNQCPFGEPFSSPDTSRPFLCGLQPNKPQCPVNFLCNVLSGNDYGVCCPLMDKPGQCPTELEDGCGQSCKLDMECPGPERCCQFEKCGNVCTKPVNMTLCQQQRLVVQLLISRNPEYESYVPQCHTLGEFMHKQCTTNGLCWCVDIQTGEQIKGTLGPSPIVQCRPQARNAIICPELTSCNLNCTFGLRSDSDGCELCKCAEPCQEIDCPDDATCVVLKEEPCISGNCPPIATCMRENQFSCSHGSPLMDTITQEPVSCHTQGKSCPSSHKCVPYPDQLEGVCCPVPNPVPKDSLLQQENQQFIQNYSQTKLPTMCEYLRDMGNLLESRNTSLAMAIPTCRPDGSYEPIQCQGNRQCYCVDEFGTELTNTHGPKGKVDCREVRRLRTCLGLLCRLGCDYGFGVDAEGCPICECRNPCQNAVCPTGQMCVMAQPPCQGNWCPAVPQCLARPSAPSCPVGRPLMFQEKEIPVECTPQAAYPTCPGTHTCVPTEGNNGIGMCCPRIILQHNLNKDSQASVESKEDSTLKSGQCPYLIPSKHESCTFNCQEDSNCPGEQICCSNGCGSQCTDPLLLTACQHQKTVAEHRAREEGIPPFRIHIPICLPDGLFQPMQFDPASSQHWCVDPKTGFENPGTRVKSTVPLDCRNTPDTCPEVFNCNLDCPNGFEIGKNQCHICACKDPCRGMVCNNPQEECRAVQVKCVTGPCPPIPLCMASLSNPCPIGEPLLNETSGITKECGALSPSCPSSHKCHVSPLGEFSVCCPKTRDVCYQKLEVGLCKASIPRWYFNSRLKTCQQFLYGGCSDNTNLNNFESKEDCEATCPVLSECERIREKNLKIKNTVNKVVFIPKCHRKNGDWQPIQCLDALGICWCVNSKGDQLPGSVVRGTPSCSSRSAKSLGDIPICAQGEPVYQCPDDLCSRSSCLAFPKAICKINPCGKCKAEFFDELNRPVNCHEGLTACQEETQEVIQSLAYFNRARLQKRSAPGIEEEDLNDQELIIMPPGVSVVVSHTILKSHEEEEKPESSSSGFAVMIGPAYKSVSIRLPNIFSPLRRFLGDEPVQESIEEIYITKEGVCPPPTLWGILRSISFKCRHRCLNDGTCPENQKCCMGECGLECKIPLLPLTEDTHKEEISLESIIPAENRPTGEGQIFISPLMGAHLPNCSIQGGYAVVQRQGDLSWCVDKFGNFQNGTLTKGQIKCHRNGTVVWKDEIEPVCPYTAGKVCHHECLKASCPQHPEALCVADPCNNCAVHFVNERLERVNCEDKCSQPPQIGNCHGEGHFFFDPESQSCKEAKLCPGSDNRFETYEECHQQCQESKPVCEQPVEVGLCRDSMQRWAYDPVSHTCQSFTYGGCGGNQNNFATEQQCQAICPDLVYCPWASVTQELEPCSRVRVCSNATCPGNSEAICMVDPCKCAAVFRDHKGHKVECQPPPTIPRVVIPFVASQSRCLHLRSQRLKDTNQHQYIPECNKTGTFQPTQCLVDQSLCWCVDEAGIQLPDSDTFEKSKAHCVLVPIKSVDVTLSFQHEGSPVKRDTDVTVRRLTRHLLKQLNTQTEGEVDVEPNLRTTKVIFTLNSPNKVDAAFKLEEMVKTGGLVLQLKDGVMVADYRHSHFYYVSSSIEKSSKDEEVEVFAKNIPDTHMAISASPKDRWTLTIMALVMGLGLLAVAFLIAILVFYKKKNGEYPRDSLVSMAFNSPLYGFIQRKPQTKISLDQKEPKVVAIQTIEAEYATIQNKENESLPPSYEEVKDLSVKL